MFTRVSYTAIGLFVVVLGIGLVAGGLWFSADLESKTYREFLVFPDESLAGISRNSSVKYQGINVGQVEAIGISDDGRPRIRIAVEKDVPVRRDTSVRIASQGLTGLGHLGLVPGDASEPPTAGDYELPVLPNAPSLRSRLESGGQSALESINRTAERVRRLLSDDNLQNLSRTLDNLETLSGNLEGDRAQLRATLAEAEALMGDTREVVQAAPGTLTRVEASMDRFDEAVGSVHTLADDLGETRSQGDAALEKFREETLPELHRTLRDFRAMTRTVDALGRDLADEPSQIIFGDPRRTPGPGERGDR
ncbi:MAG: MlaD family protein [Ectothiorhodospiraceae bacterium]